MNMRMQPRAAGMGATRIVHHGLEPRRGISQPESLRVTLCSKTKSNLEKTRKLDNSHREHQEHILNLTPALPRWRELARHIQLGSLDGEEEVNDHHDHDGDDHGKARDVRAEDVGQEPLALEALERRGDEVGADEEQAAHEEHIGFVLAA